MTKGLVLRWMDVFSREEQILSQAHKRYKWSTLCRPRVLGTEVSKRTQKGIRSGQDASRYLKENPKDRLRVEIVFAPPMTNRSPLCEDRIDVHSSDLSLD